MRVLFFILLLTVACKTPHSDMDDVVVIHNVSIIDSDKGLVPDQSVFIKGDRIINIQKSTDVTISHYSNKIDGKGKFLIPGLWDAHMHFAYIEEMAPIMFDLFMAYGVTSLRDTGGRIEFVKKWKDKAEADPENQPRVKIAGPLLDGIPNVYDGSNPTKPPLSVGTGSVAEAVDIVKVLDSVGVDLIKAYEMLTPEQFEAVIAEAHKRGLKVTGHVPLSMDVISASNAGLNSMEHMRNLEMACVSNPDMLLQQRRELLQNGKELEGGVLRTNVHNAQRSYAVTNQDAEMTEKVLDILKENDTWQIPNLSIVTGAVTRPYLEEEWQKDFVYLPEEIEKRWRDGVATIAQQELKEDRIEYANWGVEMTKKLHDKGIKIMAGTDSPIFFLTPGRSLHFELELLVDAGLSPLEAIQSATSRPAEYFDMDDELGYIKEGMIADLLLLEKNPLDDIKNTMSIHAVIKNGKIHNGESLQYRLEKLNDR